MPLRIQQPDYGTLSVKIRKHVKAAALHPYLRLFVFLSTFIALFSAVIIKEDILPSLSSSKDGPSGDRAWRDLEIITRQPHPYNSRQNDIVRDYILSEMNKVAKEYPDVLVDDDRSSMVLDDRNDLLTRLSNGDNVTITYFEGLNVLVRIPGTSSTVSGAILLSSHFDGVSTAPGATDDGMGTVSTMELVRYFAAHRTKRDIIFNLNNGEEDFLWGAKAFANHPWSRDVLAFVNLEGAGAGGPALLFRTSNAAVASAYAGTPNPHVSQLGNDFFKSGLIRSETDYVIYEDMNEFTPGLDVAFFKPRALYHTGLDDIRHTSRGSLQHMLSTGLVSVRNLANDIEHETFAYGGQPVYFDFLGGNFADIRMGVLWIWDLLLLLFCPWILGYAFHLRVKKFGKVMLKGVGVASSALFGGLIIVLGSMSLFCIHGAVLIFAHPNMVLAFSLLLTFAVFYLITRLNYLLRPAIRANPDDAERIITWELAALWHLILFITSIVSVARKIGFLFFVPISFFGTFLAALVTLLEPSTFAEPLLVDGENSESRDIDETAPLLNGDLDDNHNSIDEDEARLNGLMAPKPVSAKPKPDWRNWLWLVRFGLMVPLQALIALEMIQWHILPALNQTITEGTPISVVCLSVGFFSVLAFINTIPFLLRLPFRSTVVLIIPVFVAMIIAICSSPLNQFTPLAPFKMFYRSTYDLDTQNSTAYVYGLSPYVENVLDYVPTAKTNGFECEGYYTRGGRMCQYPIPTPPKPKADEDWFKISSSVESKDDEYIIAKLQIESNSTRVCYVEFDMRSPPEIAGIGGIRFYGTDSFDLTVKRDQCTVLRLFKRTWGEEQFSVLLRFKRESPGNVTVACGYDEWSPAGGVGFVPSLDEIWRNIPAWAGVTKFSTALLQVRKRYKLF